MTERFSLRAVRAIGVAVASLLLIAGGAFAADQLASAGHDDGLAGPTPVLAPAILDVSGSDDDDDSDDDATESPDATDDSADDSDDDATESPDATDDAGHD
ncbi:MAG TPA: hypothetical protein VLS28_06450 [Candidatus Sulfomarinibacteraceae bacterium]|nr:hypothetical protein [Candidatus Sulfomarinibacteraceae bacterium]